jgi:hypothetical protein
VAARCCPGVGLVSAGRFPSGFRQCRWRARRRVAARCGQAGLCLRYVTDYPDTDKADAEALKKCRDTTIAGVRPLCEVIQDFKNQCVAVAMDPQAGTPGVGWSVAPDLHTAEAQALSKCESTAGPGRRAACAVDHSSCDGSAK